MSGSLHVYISQTARGEFVMGGSTDPYALYSTRTTLDFKEGLMAHMLELFPFLAEAKVLRQWAGIADMTPDFSPVMGPTPVATTSSMPAGAPGASRRRRSAASAWPSASPPARRRP